MFSPRQSASFIESKIVSIVASACFCVTPRLTTRMLMRSDLSIGAPEAGATSPWKGARDYEEPSRSLRNQQGFHRHALLHAVAGVGDPAHAERSLAFSPRRRPASGCLLDRS